MAEYPQRILCLGVTGSGKSTLAINIASALELPVHLVDEEFGWLPGWVSRDAAEQKRMVLDVAAGACWVFDSAYSFYRQDLIDRAQLIVCLDYPRLTSLARLVRRSIRRVVSGEPICNANYESWGRLLGRESILRWHAKTFTGRRRSMRALEQQLGTTKVLRFTRPRDARRWLESLDSSHLP